MDNRGIGDLKTINKKLQHPLYGTAGFYATDMAQTMVICKIYKGKIGMPKKHDNLVSLPRMHHKVPDKNKIRHCM